MTRLGDFSFRARDIANGAVIDRYRCSHVDPQDVAHWVLDEPNAVGLYDTFEIAEQNAAIFNNMEPWSNLSMGCQTAFDYRNLQNLDTPIRYVTEAGLIFEAHSIMMLPTDFGTSDVVLTRVDNN